MNFTSMPLSATVHGGLIFFAFLSFLFGDGIPSRKSFLLRKSPNAESVSLVGYGRHPDVLAVMKRREPLGVSPRGAEAVPLCQLLMTTSLKGSLE